MLGTTQSSMEGGHTLILPAGTPAIEMSKNTTGFPLSTASITALSADRAIFFQVEFFSIRWIFFLKGMKHCRIWRSHFRIPTSKKRKVSINVFVSQETGKEESWRTENIFYLLWPTRHPQKGLFSKLNLLSAIVSLKYFTRAWKLTLVPSIIVTMNSLKF